VQSPSCSSSSPIELWANIIIKIHNASLLHQNQENNLLPSPDHHWNISSFSELSWLAKELSVAIQSISLQSGCWSPRTYSNSHLLLSFLLPLRLTQAMPLLQWHLAEHNNLSQFRISSPKTESLSLDSCLPLQLDDSQSTRFPLDSAHTPPTEVSPFQY